jgi:hypothetical protein
LGFLTTLSARVLQVEGDHSSTISNYQRQTQWLGADPASLEAIAEAEDRLEHRLPPSYRAFLQVSNGFGPVSVFVHRLRPVKQIEWFSNENPEALQIWLETEFENEDASGANDRMYGDYQPPARLSHLKNALQISDDFEGSVILLIPQVVDLEGEWETWHFAPWLAGAHRFPSFHDFMEEGTLALAT